MIHGVELTDLSMVAGESGAVHHFMRASDPLFVGFGDFEQRKNTLQTK